MRVASGNVIRRVEMLSRNTQRSANSFLTLKGHHKCVAPVLLARNPSYILLAAVSDRSLVIVVRPRHSLVSHV